MTRATWSIIAETSALRRDGALFVKTLLVRPQSRAIRVLGSVAYVEYLYWTRLFVDVTFEYARVTYERHGLFHRLDGPALIGADGSKYWYMHGKKHRIGGPAVESVREDKGGRVDQEWYIHGKRHRNDGPARVLEDRQEWWFNNKRHRLDGPAVQYSDGLCEWYIHGTRQNVGTRTAVFSLN